MKIFILPLLVIALSAATRAQDAKCDCPRVLDYVSSKIRTVYAGYPTKINAANQSDYLKLEHKIKDAAPQIVDPDSCFLLASKLTDFFKDLHLRVQYDWRYSEKFPERMAAIRSKRYREPKEVSRVSNKTGIRQLDSRTLLLCLPSFESDHKAIIDSLLATYAARLARAARLIVDLRGNDGGYDYVYSALLPLIYANPYLYYHYEILASPEAIEMYRENAANKAHSKELREFFSKAVKLMESRQGRFVSLSGKRVDTIRMDAVARNPSRGALILDRGTMSAAENFVQAAIQSKKVTTFGQNTGGAVDFTEVLWLKIPDFPQLQLVVPVQRSTRLPEVALDNIGISPQVRIEEGEEPYAYISTWWDRHP